MTKLHNPLSAGAADDYVDFIKTRLDAGDDAAALETALRGFDSLAAGVVVKQRLDQAFIATKRTRILSNGQVTVTQTGGGTGYAIGDKIPVNGDGVGAEITVTSVNAGVIDGFTATGGQDYISTAAADSTGVGNDDATFTTAIDNDINTLEVASAAVQAA